MFIFGRTWKWKLGGGFVIKEVFIALVFIQKRCLWIYAKIAPTDASITPQTGLN